MSFLNRSWDTHALVAAVWLVMMVTPAMFLILELGKPEPSRWVLVFHTALLVVEAAVATVFTILAVVKFRSRNRRPTL